MSAVSVLVMDCTTTGAPSPTRMWPTFTAYVLRRGCLLALLSNPSICVNILYNSNVIQAFPEAVSAARFGGYAGEDCMIDAIRRKNRNRRRLGMPGRSVRYPEPDAPDAPVR